MEDLGGLDKDPEIVYNSSSEKDKLEAWQVFYCSCCLTLDDSGGGCGWAGDVLAVGWCWLEERRLVVACQLVKTAVVCQSTGSSALRVCFRKSFKVLICCVDFLFL